MERIKRRFRKRESSESSESLTDAKDIAKKELQAPHVMISYNHTHSKKAGEIFEILTENGIKVWLGAEA